MAFKTPFDRWQKVFFEGLPSLEWNDVKDKEEIDIR